MPCSTGISARQPSSRPIAAGSSALRSSSPGRSGFSSGWTSVPASRCRISSSSSTLVSRAVPTLNVPESSGRGRGDEGTRDVADVNVVARRLAEAVHDDLLAAGQAVREDRDDAGLAVRLLSRPVDVAEAQHDVREPVQPPPGRDVRLAGELRRTVGRERLGWEGLRRRQRSVVPVDRAAGRREDHRGARGARRFAHVQRAADVDVEVVLRALDRHGDARLRREVADRRPGRTRRSTSPSCCASRMSKRRSSAAEGTFSSRPAERSSITSTAAPSARNASATCEPMKPAPPVTTTRPGLPGTCGILPAGRARRGWKRSRADERSLPLEADRRRRPARPCRRHRLSLARRGPLRGGGQAARRPSSRRATPRSRASGSRASPAEGVPPRRSPTSSNGRPSSTRPPCSCGSTATTCSTR